MNRTRIFFSLVSIQCLTISISLLILTASALAVSGEQVIYRFQGGTDGYAPGAALLVYQGNLYGTTVEGGTVESCGGQTYINGCGTVFELTQANGAWTETVLYRFQGGNDGYAPGAALVADKEGNLYSTTSGGGTLNNGTIFELVRPAVPGGEWTHAVLYNFKGVPTENGLGDGSTPGGIVFDANGNLYGTTVWGGSCSGSQGLSYCYGSVFKLAPPSAPGAAWSESVIHRFGASGNSNPHGAVVLDADGNLYGTAYIGGTYGFGGVFEVSPPSGSGSAWKATALYDFNSTDGGAPNDSLIFDSAGNLYGTTLIGGTYNTGVAFELSPPTIAGAPWTETVLYNFGASGDGNSPLGNVILNSCGDLFGTTWEGGKDGQGTVFELAFPSSPGGEWTETIVHNFGVGSDGQQPRSGLVWGPNGALYGTASEGGSTTVSDNCMLDGYAWTCGAVYGVAP
jgi:uncharacterized repeat protein (TIGR03803 family)